MCGGWVCHGELIRLFSYIMLYLSFFFKLFKKTQRTTGITSKCTVFNSLFSLQTLAFASKDKVSTLHIKSFLQLNSVKFFIQSKQLTTTTMVRPKKANNDAAAADSPAPSVNCLLKELASHKLGAPMATPTKALKQPCFYPHYMMVIDYLGDALLCPHDWGKLNILGNIKTQNFQDIWVSEKLNTIRAKLAVGNRCDAPCNGCDAKGTLMGKKHVQAWKRLAKNNFTYDSKNT